MGSGGSKDPDHAIASLSIASVEVNGDESLYSVKAQYVNSKQITKLRHRRHMIKHHKKLSNKKKAAKIAEINKSIKKNKKVGTMYVATPKN